MALASELGPNQAVLIALSGGADSVFLLNLVARAVPRPRILAMHVEHGLRGEESREDSIFCARLCARLGVPFARTHIELDPEDSNLEAKARKLRYGALGKEAREAGINVILTGHHDDDALETLLMRMMRGSELAGLTGPKARFALAGEPKIEVVRPLGALRREEVRQILRREGVAWRDDSSNAGDQFTRSRVRQGLLPEFAGTPGGMDGLRAFAKAVEGLEEELAERTLHLSWSPLPGTEALGRHNLQGGVIARKDLTRLAGPLQRRALWRLIHEGTGKPAGKTVLALIQSDLEEGRNIRRNLPGDWQLILRSSEVQLCPPGHTGPQGGRAPEDTSISLEGDSGGTLNIPGRLVLPGGAELIAEKVDSQPGDGYSTDPNVVELDAQDLPGSLRVRLPQPGDRFHPIGGPGSKELSRFLANAGVHRDARSQMPVVFAEDELVWVPGVRPCESRRIRSTTTSRIRLTLKPVQG
ncbi:MAG: tRNA(Ile)-lysidine synthase [Planctomycetota bacterium]|jgi:tRNA(Ile)-lysidine synthase